MPRGDRRGPEGYGPRSGRGLGYCSGYDSPGFTKGTPRGGAGFGGNGRGFGHGMGRGMGWRHQQAYPVYSQAPTFTKEQELDMLKNQAEQIQLSLDSINKRIEELGK